jgi:CubicO group peptidase (beta-lactamase class C family)
VRADPGYFTEPYPYSHWDIRFAFETRSEAFADETGTADGTEPADRDAGAAIGESGPGGGNGAAELAKRRKSAWIRAVLAGKPLCEPGRAWNYSSDGYRLLGEIVARASGMPYEDYVMRHIVEPLGMTRTFFEVPEELHGEVCVTNDWDEQRLARRVRADEPPLSAGGLYSTLEDLFRFGQMLLQNGRWGSERILSRKSVERMTRNHFAGRDLFGFAWGGRNPRTAYGMGASVTGENEWASPGSFGHEGAGRCKLLVDPHHQAVVVFFVPTAIHWVPESILHTNHLIAAGWV